MTSIVLPDALTVRPMRVDDAPRWSDLLDAVEAVDRRGEHYDVDDCVEELTDPELDRDADTVLVLDGEHTVAYQVLRLRSGAERMLTADGAVHPAYRGRGIGSSLLAEGRRRADALDVGLAIRVAESNAGAVELAAAAGLVAVRWWSEMERDLALPVAPAPLPDGLAPHVLGPTYRGELWDEPLRTAHNAAFADHWGSAPTSADAWRHTRTLNRNFRPECSVAACLPSRDVVGYVLSYEFRADTLRTGAPTLYVATVGTVAAWRGRGVAGALLARVLGAAVEHGYPRSTLTVDTQNPTGALGVYERAGYVLDRREVTFAR